MIVAWWAASIDFEICLISTARDPHVVMPLLDWPVSKCMQRNTRKESFKRNNKEEPGSITYTVLRWCWCQIGSIFPIITIVKYEMTLAKPNVDLLWSWLQWLCHLNLVLIWAITSISASQPVTSYLYNLWRNSASDLMTQPLLLRHLVSTMVKILQWQMLHLLQMTAVTMAIRTDRHQACLPLKMSQIKFCHSLQCWVQHRLLFLRHHWIELRKVLARNGLIFRYKFFYCIMETLSEMLQNGVFWDFQCFIFCLFI